MADKKTLTITKMPLGDEKSWKNLKDLHARVGSKVTMRELFAQDPERFAKYTYTFCIRIKSSLLWFFKRFIFLKKYSRKLQTPDGEILFDFSKNIINDDIWQGLLTLVSLIFKLIQKKAFTGLI